MMMLQMINAETNAFYAESSSLTLTSSHGEVSGFPPVTLNILIECDESEDKGENDPTGGEEGETSNLLIWQCYSRGDTTLPAS